MKLWKTITVGTSRGYVQVPILLRQFKRPLLGQFWCGRTGRKPRIYLSNDLRGEERAQVLTHELTHLLIWANQLRIKPVDHEEVICRMMEQMPRLLWESGILDFSGR